jgi:hypothetical protein
MNNEDLKLINGASADLNKIKFKDGTEYFRMPNGTLVRSSPRAYKIRKRNKLNKK